MIYYTWKNVKSTYNNNKFKISAPNWNETFDLPDGSYNISEIQDYIEYIIKKHETISENAPILIYANTINNKIVFKIKSGYKLELLSKETMKLLGSTSPHSLVFLKTMNTEFSEIEVWFTDQNNNALEIEDNVNISLIINTS